MTGERVAEGATQPLAVDGAELARCVSCGLCLPACPTWRVTGEERSSPRGRITAMRAVQWSGAPVDDEFAAMMGECVQCRGCEPVCPAFVPFGHLMEGARAALHERGHAGRTRRVVLWVAYRLVLPWHAVLMAMSWLAWLGQRLRIVPRRLGVPRLSARSMMRPLRDSKCSGDPVWLLAGCVMDAWMRDDHRATQRVVEAARGAVRYPGRKGDCCGALHAHAGRLDDARRLAGRVIASMPGDAPVLVDSAGCGAAMKDYGRLLGTDDARAFSARVRDAHEWVAERGVTLHGTGRTVVVQDPCHLRHVQRADGAVRSLLAQAYEVRETDDGGLCCGAGGAYAVLQPRLSARIRDRKVERLTRAGDSGSGGPPVVASANPGCIAHLSAAGVDVRHPMRLLADALVDAVADAPAGAPENRP